MNTTTGRKQIDPSGSKKLPVEDTRDSVLAGLPEEKSKKKAGLQGFMHLFKKKRKLLLLALVVSSLFGIGLEQWIVYMMLPSLPSSSKGSGRRRKTSPSMVDAEIAIISMHKGIKYHGYLGSWLKENKRAYAMQHSYAYFDEDNYQSDQLPPLVNEEQQVEGRAIYYEKPRLLLYLMKEYPNLQWLLWLDGDALFTRHDISVEERISIFRGLHNDDFPCLVWMKDRAPNAGVLLLNNSETTRALLETSLNTYQDTLEFQTFTDQASLTTAVQSDSTFQSCQLLLSNTKAVLLQSRVRGWALWKPEHWILHLPNHNILELVTDLNHYLTASNFGYTS